MTEEHNTPSTNQEKPALAFGDRASNNKFLQWAHSMHGIMRWGSLLISIFTLGLYIQSTEWQLLIVGLALLVVSVIFFFSYIDFDKNNKDRADSLFLIAMVMAFSLPELVISGFTIFNVGASVLLMGIYSFFSRPRRNWQIITALFVLAFVVIITLFDLWPRLAIQDSMSFQVGIFPGALIATILLFIVWRLLGGIQESNITIRLVLGFTLAGLVPLIIISIINGGLYFNQSQDTVEENLELISFLTSQDIDQWTNEIETTLSNTISTGQMNNFNKFMVDRAALENPEEFYLDIKELLNKISVGSASINELSILDTNGQVIISTNDDLEGTIVAEEIYFTDGQSDFYIEMPKYVPQLDKIITTAAYPLNQSSALSLSGKRFVGMLTAELNTQVLFSFFNEINTLVEASTTETYLISADNILVSPSRYFGNEVGSPIITNSAITAAITEEASGLGQYTSYHKNTEVIGIFRWIPELQSVLITEQSRSEAFAPFQQNIIINIVITLIGGSAAVLLGWTNTQNISRPILLLTETMKELTQGNFSQRVEIDRTDEIGQLGESVNEMTIQLRNSIENLEGVVSERTEELEQRAKYLQAAAEVGQAAAQFYSLDDLLVPVTHLISERFSFYHVGIFLVDEEKEFAVLRAANSEGGWRMLARGHRLRVGEEGIVGNVTSTREPKVLQQVGTDEIYFDNPDLPLTRSEMALPLEASGELIGALDVQSTEENAFSDEDVSVLQVLANQVALAIYNARLFDQLQASVESERRVFGELSQEAWAELLRSKVGLDIQATEHNVNVVNTRINAEARQAINEKKTIQTARGSDEGYSLSIPIKVHGNVVIGVIETNKSPNAGPWLIQEIAVMEAIGEQLGIALENARLFDETQRLAFRERIAADVAGKVWASSDVETILQTTVEELSRALNASHGTIRLRFEETAEEGTAR